MILLRIPLLLAAFSLLGCGKFELGKLIPGRGPDRLVRSQTQGCLEISGMPVDTRNRDSLATMSPNTLEFRLRVSPAPGCRDTVNFHASDVVYAQARGQEGIDRAVHAFQEALGSKIWLRAGNKRVRPAFYHVESVLGLDNSREIWVVFHPDESERKQLSESKAIELAADNIVPGQGIFLLSWPKEVIAHGT